MKKAKVLAAVMLLMCVALLFSACSKKNENIPESGSSSQESSNSIKELKGTVEDATMNTVSVRDTAGVLYSFATEDAIIDSPSGLQIGDAVTVYYTGELDTATAEQTKASVDRVVVTKVASANSADSSEPVVEEKQLSGTVEDVTESTVDVSDAEGVTYQFSTEGVEIEASEDGIQADDNVTVYYTGDLQTGAAIARIVVNYE